MFNPYRQPTMGKTDTPVLDNFGIDITKAAEIPQLHSFLHHFFQNTVRCQRKIQFRQRIVKKAEKLEIPVLSEEEFYLKLK